jgi:hypothetical protein
MLLIASSAAFGFLAVAVRESSVVAPVAVRGVVGWSYLRRRDATTDRLFAWRPRDGVGLALVIGALVVATVLLLQWRSGVAFGGRPGVQSVSDRLVDLGDLDLWRTIGVPSLQALFTLGLLTLPATVLVSTPRLLRSLWHSHAALALGAALASTAVAVLAWKRGPLGNYVMRVLGPSMSAGIPTDRMSKTAWSVIALLAGYSCFVLGLCLASAAKRVADRRAAGTRSVFDPTRDVVVAFVLLSVAVLVVSPTIGHPLYDRHLLPLIPFVAAFVLLEGGVWELARERFALVAGAALGAFAVLSLLFTATTAAFEAARWRAASELVDAGVPALGVDGGLDWVGFHSNAPIRHHRVTDPQNSWWASSYDDFHPCVVVLVGGSEPGDAFRPQPVRIWITRLPFGKDVQLRAFERNDCNEYAPAAQSPRDFAR